MSSGADSVEGGRTPEGGPVVPRPVGTGAFVCPVNTLKKAPETTVVGIDAWTTNPLPPATDETDRALRNPAAAVEVDGLGGIDRSGRETGRSAIPATITGPIGESGDVVCEGRPPAPPERSDPPANGNAGADGYEMADTSDSRPRPAGITLDGGDARAVRRCEALAALTDPETDSDFDPDCDTETDRDCDYEDRAGGHPRPDAETDRA